MDDDGGTRAADASAGDGTAPAPSRTRDGRGASVVPKAAVIAGGGALAVWEPAFTLGAYNVIFYYQTLTLWAVSTAVLPAGLLMRERGPRHGRVYWACLALPSAWLGLPPSCRAAATGRARRSSWWAASSASSAPRC
ncbi:hypothetical protein ACFVRD_22875 [Streptomyces sp. NPDC057908]|uniref:hypothetical protein n=1 Tax=Streptomyces sp. NPDC057908 TaxID=3346276 RepID=UPI0036E06988